MFLIITACSQYSERASFDHITCLENIPSRVKGLKILSGPRTEQSVIRNMVPAVCNGHVLFDRMRSTGEALNTGHVVFKVHVEYTGEVHKVTVEESTIQSKEFLRKVSNFIMDTDFVPWVRHDTDTVFLYPVRFGQ